MPGLDGLEPGLCRVWVMEAWNCSENRFHIFRRIQRNAGYEVIACINFAGSLQGPICAGSVILEPGSCKVRVMEAWNCSDNRFHIFCRI